MSRQCFATTSTLLAHAEALVIWKTGEETSRVPSTGPDHVVIDLTKAVFRQQPGPAPGMTA